MDTKELLAGLFQTVTEQVHLPEGYSWLPLAATGSVAVFGLLLLLRGARWAPGLSAMSFLAIGGIAGHFLAGQIGTPLWPTVGIAGLLGAIIGVLFFRLWQAALLAGCMMLAGFSVYFVQVLTPEVTAWVSPEPAAFDEIRLSDPGTVVGDSVPGVCAKLGSLWTHLSANVPNFQTTFWALLISTTLAGLVFGLLLPRASRALWAASVGTVLLGVGGVGVLKQVAPDTLTWLKTHDTWAWGLVAVVWIASLAYGFLSVRRGRRPRASTDVEAPPEGKPAIA